LLCELLGWGVAPSLQHYEHLAETYALHRDVAAAEQVLDRMQAAGHTPLLRSYNMLLSGVAMNGDMAAATRVYARLKAQGLTPDEQTMRALFKCVRVYAGRVRVDTARKQALAKPGDRWVHVLGAVCFYRLQLQQSWGSNLVREVMHAGLLTHGKRTVCVDCRVSV
jgi:pentatricopeptide repeat protein